ncbi:MAG: J domain-containing protein [Elusimicrobiota bacterium]
MTTEEAYSILDVEAGASPKEVQQAYRRQAMRCHPDRARSAAEAQSFTKRFIEVRDAYEYLRTAGFPVAETEEVLYDVIDDLPPMTPAGRSFAPKKDDEYSDISLAEKLGFGFSVNLEAISLWGIIIPAGAVIVVLFVRWLFRVLAL